MPWLQVSVISYAVSTARIEDELTSLGALSVTLRDAADGASSEPILEPAPGETPLWRQPVVTGLFDISHNPERLQQQIRQALQDEHAEITTGSLDDQDWTRTWMAAFQPMRFGVRLWVCPWHLEPPDTDAVNLRLDPGLAFGTGTHPTTSLCLRWLDANFRQRRVLDYGCGSGILAIAAMLLGAESADCVDIDEQALIATRENARANAVECGLRTFRPGDIALGHYDLVIANILSGPLTELAPMLAEHTTGGGDIVLSGILESQAETVSAAYAAYFDMDTTETDGDWVLLHGRKRA